MIAIPSLVQSKFPNFANAVQLATDILSNKDISSYKTATIPLINLVGYGIDGILVRKLLQRGINPAGEAFRFQWYEKDPGVGLYHWSTAYDFENYSLVQNPNFKDKEYESQIKSNLRTLSLQTHLVNTWELVCLMLVLGICVVHNLKT